jgi:beta-lactamase regulating signal transducer with metallopeptidase domain
MIAPLPIAQFAIERVLNTLPEGLLIAAFAWAMLRTLPKQNSRTRFAVWFLALVAVALVPVFSGIHASIASRILPGGAPSISLPSNWAAFFLIGWLLAALIATARLAFGLWRLRQLRKSCAPIELSSLDPDLREIFDELNATPSLASSFATRKVTLATSDSVRVPAAFGLWKPMIVFPAWTMRELSPAELGVILRHEFAHLERWDDWTNLFQKFVRALFFFHPAVWWIERRLSIEREMACDDVVVAQTGNPTGYATCLVSLLERSLAQRGWSMAQAIVHRAREASERLAQILDRDRPVATQVSRPALGMAGAFTLLCLVVVPNSPQVVAFEQNSPTAAYSYASSLAPPVGLSPALIHPAGFETPSPARPSPRSCEAVTMELCAHRTGDPAHHRNSEEFAPTQPSRISAHATTLRTGRSDHQNVAEEIADNSIAHTDDLIEEFASGMLRPASTVLEEQPAVAPAMSTFVVFQSTQFVGSDSGSNAISHITVWRIQGGQLQIWHMVVVNPTFERRTHVPVAHST